MKRKAIKVYQLRSPTKLQIQVLSPSPLFCLSFIVALTGMSVSMNRAVLALTACL